MTVFVVHQTDDDISAARHFGRIKTINHRYVHADELRSDNGLPPAFAQNLVRAANGFIPDEDYLLIVGDHVQLLAFAAMLAVRYDWYNVLRYDRREKAYFPVRIQV